LFTPRAIVTWSLSAIRVSQSDRSARGDSASPVRKFLGPRERRDVVHPARGAPTGGNLSCTAPGVGKTHIGPDHRRSNPAHHFASLNAVLAGVKELRAEVEAAASGCVRHGLARFLFIDGGAIRFNSAPAGRPCCPGWRNGTVTRRRTTEKPLLRVNKAFGESLARLFRLRPWRRMNWGKCAGKGPG